ncbi:T9SS type A sorting domain-containing protein [Vicingaceae bacterium]|nr:T9SS type A sorting domain-containing protein [Vicingaceae bacterium]
MRVLLYISLFFLLTIASLNSFSQGNFYAISNTVITASPNNCSATQVDVLTYLGCINFVNNGATFSISNDTIKITVKYTSSPICFGALSQPLFNVMLDTLPAANYIISTSAILDATAINTIYTPLSVASCCPTTSSLEASFSLSDSVFCEGQRIQLTNISLNAQSFKWYLNNVLTTSLTQPFLDSLTPGSYSVRLEADSAFCSDDTTLSFIVAPKPTISLGADTTICQGSSITISAAYTNAVSYMWQDSSTADTFTVSSAGVYYVEIIDSLGCSASDTINIAVSVCTGLNSYINNSNDIIISPNPIKTNQKLYISTTHNKVLTYDFEIYTFTGKLVTSGEVELSSQLNEIETQGLNKGVYFITLINQQQGVKTRKFIIQ